MPLSSDGSGDLAGSSLIDRFLAIAYIDVSDGSKQTKQQEDVKNK